ncbi:hypothetical protein Q0M94_10765 [Deinococcus radiomollis]
MPSGELTGLLLRTAAAFRERGWLGFVSPLLPFCPSLDRAGLE